MKKMSNAKKLLVKKILLVAPVFLFVFVWLWPSGEAMAFIFFGPMLILMALATLEDVRGVRRVALLFVVYPLLFLLFSFLASEVQYWWIEEFASFGLVGIFSMLYVIFGLKKFWLWVDEKIKSALVMVFTLMIIFGVGTAYLSGFCGGIAISEKGVTEQELAFCSSAALTENAGLGGADSDLYVFLVYGPSFFTLLLLTLLPFSKNKEQVKN